jgi:hypothetical protein
MQVRIARSVAAKFDASIIGVSAFAVEPNFVSEGVIIEETTPEDLKRMKTALAEKEKWFRDIVAFPKERVEWRWKVDYPTAFLANEARSADLVVVPRKRVEIDPYRSINSASAVLRMGRPTLLVPEHVSDLRADRILVGWRDTREARLAVRDALPFLTRAMRHVGGSAMSQNFCKAMGGNARLMFASIPPKPMPVSSFVWQRKTAPISL